MKNRIYIVIFHIAGALIATVLSQSLAEHSIYDALPFLKKIEEIFSVYENLERALIIIIIMVAILTIINTKYKKNKLLIPKYI